MIDQFWKMKSLMGFFVLQLDKDLYIEFIKESVYKGLRVDNLFIQVEQCVCVNLFVYVKY